MGKKSKIEIDFSALCSFDDFIYKLVEINPSADDLAKYIEEGRLVSADTLYKFAKRLKQESFCRTILEAEKIILKKFVIIYGKMLRDESKGKTKKGLPEQYLEYLPIVDLALMLEITSEETKKEPQDKQIIREVHENIEDILFRRLREYVIANYELLKNGYLDYDSFIPALKRNIEQVVQELGLKSIETNSL